MLLRCCTDCCCCCCWFVVVVVDVRLRYPIWHLTLYSPVVVVTVDFSCCCYAHCVVNVVVVVYVDVYDVDLVVVVDCLLRCSHTVTLRRYGCCLLFLLLRVVRVAFTTRWHCCCCITGWFVDVFLLPALLCACVPLTCVGRIRFVTLRLRYARQRCGCCCCCGYGCYVTPVTLRFVVGVVPVLRRCYVCWLLIDVDRWRCYCCCWPLRDLPRCWCYHRYVCCYIVALLRLLIVVVDLTFVYIFVLYFTFVTIVGFTLRCYWLRCWLRCCWFVVWFVGLLLRLTLLHWPCCCPLLVTLLHCFVPVVVTCCDCLHCWLATLLLRCWFVVVTLLYDCCNGPLVTPLPVVVTITVAHFVVVIVDCCYVDCYPVDVVVIVVTVTGPLLLFVRWFVVVITIVTLYCCWRIVVVPCCWFVVGYFDCYFNIWTLHTFIAWHTVVVGCWHCCCPLRVTVIYVTVLVVVVDLLCCFDVVDCWLRCCCLLTVVVRCDCYRYVTLITHVVVDCCIYCFRCWLLYMLRRLTLLLRYPLLCYGCCYDCCCCYVVTQRLLRCCWFWFIYTLPTTVYVVLLYVVVALYTLLFNTFIVTHVVPVLLNVWLRLRCYVLLWLITHVTRCVCYIYVVAPCYPLFTFYDLVDTICCCRLLLVHVTLRLRCPTVHVVAWLRCYLRLVWFPVYPLVNVVTLRCWLRCCCLRTRSCCCCLPRYVAVWFRCTLWFCCFTGLLTLLLLLRVWLLLLLFTAVTLILLLTLIGVVDVVITVRCCPGCYVTFTLFVVTLLLRYRYPLLDLRCYDLIVTVALCRCCCCCYVVVVVGDWYVVVAFVDTHVYLPVGCCYVCCWRWVGWTRLHCRLRLRYVVAGCCRLRCLLRLRCLPDCCVTLRCYVDLRYDVVTRYVVATRCRCGCYCCCLTFVVVDALPLATFAFVTLGCYRIHFWLLRFTRCYVTLLLWFTFCWFTIALFVDSHTFVLLLVIVVIVTLTLLAVVTLILLFVDVTLLLLRLRCWFVTLLRLFTFHVILC